MYFLKTSYSFDFVLCSLQTQNLRHVDNQTISENNVFYIHKYIHVMYFIKYIHIHLRIPEIKFRYMFLYNTKEV